MKTIFMTRIGTVAVVLAAAALVQGCSAPVVTQQSSLPGYVNTGVYSGPDWNASVDAQMDNIE